MKVGDIIKFLPGAKAWWHIKSNVGIVVDKIEYSCNPPRHIWLVQADGKLIKLNQQIENMAKVINGNR